MIGETIKGFKLIARLGSGGMGDVWAGEQPLVKTKVAIKVLRAEVSSDSQQVQRFFNEAIAVSKIPHAGIVKIFDVGLHGERAYLISEFLDGVTLASLIRAVGHLELSRVVDLGRQIASVLAATHAAGITHRDLKPDNVFVIRDDELASKQRVKILDFGIAKLGASGSGMTATGGSMGTPAYMAPEQWNDAAKADARADIYSFGCVAFEMCTGRPPFLATSVGEACTQHLTESPPRARSLVPDLPEALDALIDRMLAKAAAERPTIQEIHAVLGSLGGDLSDSLRETLPAPGDHAPPRPLAATTTTLGGAASALATPPTRRTSIVLGACFVATIAAAGIYVATRGTEDPTPTTTAPVATPVAPVAPDAQVIGAPKLGLETIEKFREPKGSEVSTLLSESLWSAARDDLAAGCVTPGAPVRWCAAREVADGQIAIIRFDSVAAAAAFGRAHALDPGWALPLVGLAGARSNQDDLKGALEAAQLAQRLDPRWWQAIAAAGRAYTAAMKFDEAIGEYRRAMSLAPNNAVLLAELALLYHSARMDTEAAKHAAAALALDDEMVAVHLLRAELALERGDSKTAIEEADRALAVSPKNDAAHLARGDGLALAKRKAEAFSEYHHALELRGERSTGAPAERIRIVEAALAKDALPPPRPKTTQRSRTKQRIDGRIDSGERSRPKCGTGDPSCGSNL